MNIDECLSTSLFRQLRPYSKLHRLLKNYALSLTRKDYGSSHAPSSMSSGHWSSLGNDGQGPERASVLTRSPDRLSSPTNMDDDSSLDTVVWKINDLLSKLRVSEVFEVISQGINRKLFESLIANISPTTRYIARFFLPAAIQCADVSMVKALLATGVDTNFDLRGRRSSSLFVVAIESGNVEIVQHFLDHGSNVNVWIYDSDDTPLEAAVRTGQLDLVRILLQAGASLNVPCPGHGASALATAISDGNLELVQFLLNCGADIRGRIRQRYGSGHENLTAIQHAAVLGDITMVKVLLSHGADVNALKYAALGSGSEMLQLLLDRGANDVLSALRTAGDRRDRHVLHFLICLEIDTNGILHDDFGRVALEAAIDCNDVEFLTWLLDSVAGASATTASLTNALSPAVQRGHLPVVQLLVARGADIKAHPSVSQFDSLLQVAVNWKHLHLVGFLIRSGADVNAPTNYPGVMILVAAAAVGDFEIVKLLLENGADMSRQGASAVAAAIESDSTKVLQLLLDAWPLDGNADVSSVVCPYGRTALEIAANCASVELTQVLLDYKVYKADDKSLALPRAISSGNLGVARLLLASGADVGYVERENCWRSDAEGEYYAFETALDKAAGCGYLDILFLLLERWTTVNERTQALQVAVNHGRLDAVRVLLDHGVNINAAPSVLSHWEPRTALQAAAESGSRELVRCLLNAGADVESTVRSTREQGTALQFAATAGSISVVKALIWNGADVRAPAIGKDGRTAVEAAAEYGRLDVVQFLIDVGAQRAGSRALEFASEEGHLDVVMLLLENGFAETSIVRMDNEIMDETEDDSKA
jgi:ankyrin repeat protein